MKPYKLLLLLLFVLSKTSAQNISKIYEGGACIESNICGYWIIKKDASFIYVSVNTFGLNSYGFGTWKIEKNQLFVEFDSTTNKIKPLMNYSITSTSKTDLSNPDSIKIIITIVNKTKNAIRGFFATINKTIDGKENNKGNIVFLIPRTTVVKMIQISSPFFDYKPVFKISNDNNNHFEFLISIDVDKFEYTTLHKTLLDYTELINDRYITEKYGFDINKKLSFRFRIIKPKEVRIHDFSISESEEKIQDIIKKLRNAQKLQPQNYSTINQIISIINK